MSGRTNDTREYGLVRASSLPEFRGLWEGTSWGNAAFLEVGHFRPESSSHRPLTLCKMLYDERLIYGLFRVQDYYVRCVHTEFQSDVYKDSCVEFFVQPKTGKGYFNFEFNCGGALLASYVTDPVRVLGRIGEFVPLSADDGQQIRIFHNMPGIVEPEVQEPVTWYLEFSIPFQVLERYVGPLTIRHGDTWSANFYKCGNDTSHPHWSSWAPVGELNFHVPQSFGKIVFL